MPKMGGRWRGKEMQRESEREKKKKKKKREGMGRGGVFSVAVAVMVLAVAVMAPKAAAQDQPPACAMKLLDCQQFISSTATPSTKCCSTIKDLVQNELTCLCGLLTNKSLLESLNINVTQALDVPRRCGVTAGTSICNTSAKSPSAPPATPGGNKPTGAAVGVRIGASTLVAFMAFWWSLLA